MEGLMETLPNGMKRIDRKDGGYDYSAVDIVVDAIVQDFYPKMIVVFGSVAKGTADKDSDLDLLIVMDTDKGRCDCVADINISLWKRDLVLEKDILVVTPEEFLKKKDDEHSFIHEIVSTGVIAYEA
jgi:predicted nucleotidyltransferase